MEGQEKILEKLAKIKRHADSAKEIGNEAERKPSRRCYRISC